MDMTIVEFLMFALLLLVAFCGGAWFGAAMPGQAKEPEATGSPEKPSAHDEATEAARQLEERERQWQNMMAYSGDRQTGE